MALSPFQKSVVNLLAGNRSETSYMAGGLVLNKDWPRQSDDLDIFHDTDEEIGASADVDIRTLREAGYRVTIDIDIYGIVEATVSGASDSTVVQWMSETRTRFFPLVRDAEWGARLHIADLAVNKMLAASTRTKARDYVDLVTISDRLCPLGPLIIAASGKPPHFSPQRIVDEIRRRGLSVSDDEFRSVKGLPRDLDARDLREELIAALDAAEEYLQIVPTSVVGLLSVNSDGTPVEIRSLDEEGYLLRKATDEHEVIPLLPDVRPSWSHEP